MPVEIDNRTSERLDEAALAGIVDGVLQDQGAGDAEAAILLVDADAMRALNREHRRRDEVTDVLAFPIDEGEELPAGMPRLLGDVVICLEQCEAQATEQGHPAGRELVMLAVHGALHLLGHDHETDGGVMLDLQDRITGGLDDVAWR
jgi:probable rRNA maturation factor